MKTFLRCVLFSVSISGCAGVLAERQPSSAEMSCSPGEVPVARYRLENRQYEWKCGPPPCAPGKEIGYHFTAEAENQMSGEVAPLCFDPCPAGTWRNEVGQCIKPVHTSHRGGASVAGGQEARCLKACGDQVSSCIARAPEENKAVYVQANCNPSYQQCQQACEANFNQAGFCHEKDPVTGESTGAFGNCP